MLGTFLEYQNWIASTHHSRPFYSTFLWNKCIFALILRFRLFPFQAKYCYLIIFLPKSKCIPLVLKGCCFHFCILENISRVASNSFSDTQRKNPSTLDMPSHFFHKSSRSYLKQASPGLSKTAVGSRLLKYLVMETRLSQSKLSLRVNCWSPMRALGH